MKSSLLSGAFLLLPVLVFSQIPSDPGIPLEYFNKYWYRATAPEQAVYIRAYMGYDSTARLNEIRDYKAGGMLMTSWHYSADKRYVEEGPVTWFGAHHQPEKKGQYLKGKRIGQWTDYYPNGCPERQYTYTDTSAGMEDTYTIDNSWDSTGKAEVRNGNGVYRERDDSSGIVIMQGMVKHGLREGIWEGFDRRGQQTYEEEYVNGKFLKGIGFGEGGACTPYDSIFTTAVFPGGLEAMMRSIYRTIRYPEEAIDMGTEGTVIVGFTIDKRGNVTDAAIQRGVSPAIDREAMRVIGKMPAWAPAVQRGKPVSVAFRLPIKFALTSKKK